MGATTRHGEYKYTHQDIAYATRQLELEENRLSIKVQKLQAELDRLQGVERQALRLEGENAELRTEIEKVRKYAESRHEEAMKWFREYNERTNAHRKLSAVMRLALTPEQYHQYREMI